MPVESLELNHGVFFDSPPPRPLALWIILLDIPVTIESYGFFVFMFSVLLSVLAVFITISYSVYLEFTQLRADALPVISKKYVSVPHTPSFILTLKDLHFENAPFNLPFSQIVKLGDRIR